MKLLRRHDRYVLGAFWAAFGAVVLFFTTIVVVMDLAERLPRIVRFWGQLTDQGHSPGWLLLEFYGSFLPFIFLKILPICVPIAAAFALARLSRKNELAPLVTSGVSTPRIVLPLVLSGMVVAGVLIVVREAAAPVLGRRQMALSRLLTKGKSDRVTKVPHMTDVGGARISMDAYLPGDRRMETAVLTLRGPDRRPTEVRWYPVLDWDARRGAWLATRGGSAFTLSADRTGIRRDIAAGDRAPIEADAGLVEVTVTERASLGLSLAESAALVRADPGNARLVAQHHEQFTAPLAAVVLLLLSLPFVLRLDTKSPLPGLVAALAGGACFYAATILTTGIGGGGALNPVVVAWTPTVLFLSLGVALTLTMRS